MAQRLSLEEGMAALVEAERAHPVSEWRVGGVRVWPFARVRIGYGISANAFGLPYGSNDRVGTVGGTAAKRALASVPAVRRALGPRSRQPVDALFLSNGISLTRFDDVVYERFCDPIREELAEQGRSSLLLVPGTSTGPFVQPARQIQMPLDVAKVRGLVFANRLDVSLPEYDGVVACLREVGLESYVPSPRFLRVGASILHAIRRHFDGLIDRTRPKVGFVVNYYKIDSMAFVLACNAAGVPSVDLQHGVQGAFHAAYARWTNVPESGYELLPRRFWVWSREEARHIDAWRPAENHEPIVGGNPFLRMCVRSRAPRMETARRAVERLPAASPPGYTVLVTLHGFESESDLEALAGTIATAPVSWRWWIRAHPRHPRGSDDARVVFARLGIDTAETEGATELPLFALLPHVDVHVTECSSVVIDAAAFGVPSVVTTSDGLAMYPAERDAGLVEHASTHDLVPTAQRLARARRQCPPVVEEGGMAWLSALLAG